MFKQTLGLDYLRSVMKQYECVEVGHHKNIGQTCTEFISKGWRLNAYQATGWGADVKHYLLFERESQ